MIKEPIKLLPAFKDYLWGGNRLFQRYGFGKSEDVIAEMQATKAAASSVMPKNGTSSGIKSVGRIK